MSYLFHVVPQPFYGRYLYPLSAIRKRWPGIYRRQLLKYKGRAHIQQQQIPYLSCGWNDVVHLTPVDPIQLLQALAKLGVRKEMEFFVIDSRNLEAQNAVVYLNNRARVRSKNFRRYDPRRITKHRDVPGRTIEYYRKKIGRGEAPLIFHGIPHILYKGRVDVKGVLVMKLRPLLVPRKKALEFANA